MLVDGLPRDVQIEIVKRAGIDARIALGIIGKLVVPRRVTVLLEAIKRPMHVGLCYADVRLRHVYVLSCYSDNTRRYWTWNAQVRWKNAYHTSFDRVRWTLIHTGLAGNMDMQAGE